MKRHVFDDQCACRTVAGGARRAAGAGVVCAVLLCIGCEREAETAATGPNASAAQATDPAAAVGTDRRPEVAAEAEPEPESALPAERDAGRAAMAPEPSMPEVAPADDGAARPRIEFDRLFHEYGDIWDVGKYVTNFRFTNTGTATLNILAVRAGCGCTTTSLRTHEYEPGESGTVDLVFSPQGTGRQVKSLTVVSDDPDEPTVELSIGARIREFAVAEPRIVRFGTVPLGEFATRRVRIRSADPDARITGVSVGGLNAGGMVARLLPDEEASVGADSIGVVEVMVHERNAWGAVYAMLEVTSEGTTPDGEQLEHVTRIACAASVYGDVHASDNMVRVEVVPPGGTFERVIRVFNPEGRAFALSGEATSSTIPMRVEVRPVAGAPEGSSYEVFVRGEAGSYMGLIRGVLILRTDVPGEETLRMNIQGIVREV